MAYEKQTWNCGDLIYTEKLNHMEDGIETNAEHSDQIDSQIDFLESRINNIIAGGTAPSEAEIVDARLGEDGQVYPSLGDAIRGQVGDLKSEMNEIYDAIEYTTTSVFKIETSGSTSPLDASYQWILTDPFLETGQHIDALKFKTALADGTSVTATFKLFAFSGGTATKYAAQTVTAIASSGEIVFDVSLDVIVDNTMFGLESDTSFGRTFESATDNRIKSVEKGVDSAQTAGALRYSFCIDAITKTSIADDVRSMQNDIGQIQDDWEDVIQPSEPVIFSFDSEASAAAGSGYAWIIKNHEIPANTRITSIKFKTMAVNTSALKINFWSTDDNVNYTKYKELELTPTIYGGYAVIDCDILIDRKSLIGVISNSNIARVDSTTDRELRYVAEDATTFSVPTVPTVNYQFLMEIKSKTNALEELNKTVDGLSADLSALAAEIHVGDGLEYEEIQDALDALTTDYATIIVHPKNTPYSRFSLMRSLGNSYPWSGLSTVKHISIIGIDKEKCIIKDDSGNYNTPPAEIATNGVIKNLRFIATHDASDGTETTGSYAVHVDNRPADINGMKLIFENCDFISYQMSAVGLGLYRNQDILFDSCNFESYTDLTWKPNENYDSDYYCSLGAYFMHTTMGEAGGNMFIRFRNCFFYHEGGYYSVRISDNDDPQTAYLEAIGNTLWNGTSESVGLYLTGHPIMQFPYNHGNNATELNA